jgi:hypothetical protein
MAVGTAQCISATYCEGWAYGLDPTQRYDVYVGYTDATFAGVSYTGAWTNTTVNKELVTIKVIGNFTLPEPTAEVSGQRSEIVSLSSLGGMPIRPRGAMVGVQSVGTRGRLTQFSGSSRK